MKGNNNLFVMFRFQRRYMIVAFDAQFVPIVKHGYPSSPGNVKTLPQEIQCDLHLQILPTISNAKLWTFSTHMRTSAGANFIKFQHPKWSMYPGTVAGSLIDPETTEKNCSPCFA